MATPGSEPARPPARCNILSVAAPLLGIAAASLPVVFSGAQGHWYWAWPGIAAMSILTTFCVGGAILALVALYRSERFWGLTMVGLLLNVPLPLVLLCSGLNFLSTWLKHG
jgi:hypothetical protein